MMKGIGILLGTLLLSWQSLGAALSIRSASDIEALKQQAAKNNRLVFIHITCRDKSYRECEIMRKEVLANPEMVDWLAKHAEQGELDVTPSGIKNPQEAANVKALTEQLQARYLPTLVVMHPNGRLLEVRPYMDDVPTQLVGLFHEIYLREMHGIVHPSEGKGSFGPAPAPQPSNPAWPVAAAPVRYDTLKLKMITGRGARRLATINNQTFAAGEKAKVILGNKKVQVQCVEIRDKSVLVLVEGETKQQELTLD